MCVQNEMRKIKPLCVLKGARGDFSFTLISVRQRGALKIPYRMHPSSLIFNQGSSGAAAVLLLKTEETNKNKPTYSTTNNFLVNVASKMSKM